MREAIDQIAMDPGKKNLETRLAFFVNPGYSGVGIVGIEENKFGSLFPTFFVGIGGIFSYMVPDVKQIHTHKKNKSVERLKPCLFL